MRKFSSYSIKKFQRRVINDMLGTCFERGFLGQVRSGDLLNNYCVSCIRSPVKISNICTNVIVHA